MATNSSRIRAHHNIWYNVEYGYFGIPDAFYHAVREMQAKRKWQATFRLVSQAAAFAVDK